MKNKNWSDVPTFAELESARKWRLLYAIFMVALAAATLGGVLAGGLQP